MSNSRREKLQCNDCHGLRWHALRTSYSVEGEEDMGGNCYEPWTDTFEIFQCRGCDSLLVRRSFLFLPIGEEAEISYFPARSSRHRPSWSWGLPPELRELLGEVYTALQSNSPRLALMGIRAVVDVAILEKVGDAGSFVEKLAVLEREGYVGQKQRNFLSAVLDAGSAAAHRGHTASEQGLEYAMDIVENLLQAVYALEGAAEHLREATPPRKRP
jgi:Domain of unknown function (DUF4145)